MILSKLLYIGLRRALYSPGLAVMIDTHYDEIEWPFQTISIIVYYWYERIQNYWEALLVGTLSNWALICGRLGFWLVQIISHQVFSSRHSK